jgi:hypothetical protein
VLGATKVSDWDTAWSNSEFFHYPKDCLMVVLDTSNIEQPIATGPKTLDWHDPLLSKAALKKASLPTATFGNVSFHPPSCKPDGPWQFLKYRLESGMDIDIGHIAEDSAKYVFWVSPTIASCSIRLVLEENLRPPQDSIFQDSPFSYRVVHGVVNMVAACTPNGVSVKDSEDLNALAKQDIQDWGDDMTARESYLQTVRTTDRKSRQEELGKHIPRLVDMAKNNLHKGCVDYSKLVRRFDPRAASPCVQASTTETQNWLSLRIRRATQQEQDTDIAFARFMEPLMRRSAIPVSAHTTDTPHPLIAFLRLAQKEISGRSAVVSPRPCKISKRDSEKPEPSARQQQAPQRDLSDPTKLFHEE